MGGGLHGAAVSNPYRYGQKVVFIFFIIKEKLTVSNPYRYGQKAPRGRPHPAGEGGVSNPYRYGQKVARQAPSARKMAGFKPL